MLSGVEASRPNHIARKLPRQVSRFGVAGRFPSKDSLHSQPEPSIAALFEARVCSEGGPVLKGNAVLKGRVFQPSRKCHTINRGFSH